jgi:hypothetical protein
MAIIEAKVAGPVRGVGQLFAYGYGYGYDPSPTLVLAVPRGCPT